MTDEPTEVDRGSRDAGEDRTLALEQRVGQAIGPYRLERLVGAGGMGVVYAAQDTRLGRRVALKFLPAEVSREPASKERFLREARAASQLDHPNICTIHDVGETEDGRLYIVMAYYRGETLDQRLRRGPLPADEARDVVAQLARGLQRAHAAGITHRDIKPANVMLTEGGRALLLDFGVAKVGGEADLTRAGSTLGTPAYMSPEQARGAPTDPRTDIWSLGVLLYEMLAGRRPFAAGDPQAVIYAILNSEPEPIETSGTDVPAALVEIVDSMLAKDPARRPQSAEALLRRLGAEVEATAAVPVVRRGRWAAAGVAALAVLALWFGWRGMERAPSPSAADGRTALAVLQFDNLRGADTELDWLRSGIPDMLITDLAQSAEIRVLSAGRLDQLLRDLGAEDESPLAPRTLAALAARAAVDTVIRGSYTRVGDVLRIDLTMEDARSGDVLDSSRAQGAVDGLFGVVDELSAAIRNRLEVTATGGVAASIRAVTTDSMEAWRFYTEGLALQRRARDSEAIALFEKAVAIDPEFALALADLGSAHGNLGHAAEERRYVERALANAERLPIGPRLSLEASYYASRWRTYGKAIEVLQQAIEREPGRENLRNNLANRYFDLERYPEAIDQYERLIAGGTEFAPTYSAAAWAHAAQGRFETGYRILADHLAAAPEDWFGHAGLAFLLTQWGRLDEAATALGTAQRLRPADGFVRWNQWRLAVLKEDWDAARAVIAEQEAASDPWERWRAEVSKARHALYAGRAADGLAALEAAAAVYAGPDPQAALAHAYRAELLLDLGRAAEARRAAEAAVAGGDGDWPELLGRFHAARAAALAGDPAGAEAHRAALEASWKSHPNVVEERQLLHLDGLLALDAGDAQTASQALARAAALLPPEGVEYHFHTLPDHVRIGYAQGLAELAAGRLEPARRYFLAVAESGVERVEFPVPWVLSFLHLGEIEEALGEAATARAWRERFLAAWPQGGLR